MVSVRAPYFQDESVTIYLGDCREILPDLTADVVLTDPPYNYGKDYGDDFNDSSEPHTYETWLRSWWSLLPTHRRIVFPGLGNLWAWQAMEPRYTACWYKPGNPSGRGAYFSFNEWEPILLWNALFSGSNVFRCPISVQEFVGDHPCPKPLRLFRDMVSRMRTEGVILDPFMGTGTTLRAAKDMGRQSIGIEISERYCEIAAKRMAQAVLPLPPPRPTGCHIEEPYQPYYDPER